LKRVFKLTSGKKVTFTRIPAHSNKKAQSTAKKKKFPHARGKPTRTKRRGASGCVEKKNFVFLKGVGPHGREEEGSRRKMTVAPTGGKREAVDILQNENLVQCHFIPKEDAENYL